jgi:NAD(P)-dependent dehydrogenase (short-subunit alcohol dehydrogenase family)
MQSANLENRNVLVTGASNETGEYVAKAFGDEGANVALTYYSDESGARSVAKQIKDQNSRTELYRFNLLDQESVDELVSDIQSDWERLDILILCAGSVGLRNFKNLSRDELDTAIDGNLKGNFMLAKELGYWMKETGGLGRIIQFTAQSAENMTHSAYGLAKASQRESGDFLAYHLAPEVTVNTIQPTSIDQDPNHNTGEEYDSPIGRKVHSRELAKMSILLCDPVFDTVTGEVIRMDAGRHLTPAYPKDL